MSLSSINIIGAGNLGKTLAKLIVQNSVGVIQAVCNRTGSSTKAAIEFIGQGEACKNILSLPDADITFITTSDDKILSCCEKLSQSDRLKKNSIVVHCSGVLAADVLESVKKKGCFIVSVHPMKSFSDPQVSVNEFKDSYCAIEGDQEAIAIIKPLFEAIGAKTYHINSDKKMIYHVAGVFASNYLVTLFQQSLDCLKEAGVDNHAAKNLVVDLMQSTLNNIQQTDSSQEALTGPIKRGDIETIKKHLVVLGNAEL